MTSDQAIEQLRQINIVKIPAQYFVPCCAMFCDDWFVGLRMKHRFPDWFADYKNSRYLNKTDDYIYDYKRDVLLSKEGRIIFDNKNNPVNFAYDWHEKNILNIDIDKTIKSINWHIYHHNASLFSFLRMIELPKEKIVRYDK